MVQPFVSGTCSQRIDTNHWLPGLDLSRSKSVDHAITIVKQGREAFWRHARKDVKGDITKYICVKGKHSL